MAEKRESKRHGNKPWKHVYGTDRAYTARVDRLAERRATAPVRASKAWQRMTDLERDYWTGGSG